MSLKVEKILGHETIPIMYIVSSTYELLHGEERETKKEASLEKLWKSRNTSKI